jgi:hypothetical protein
MILNDKIAMSVLASIYTAVDGTPAVTIRIAQLKQFSNFEPGIIHGAVEELLKAKLLMVGATDDRICLSAAGAACHAQQRPAKLAG